MKNNNKVDATAFTDYNFSPSQGENGGGQSEEAGFPQSQSQETLEVQVAAPGSATLTVTFTGTGTATNYNCSTHVNINAWGVESINVTSPKLGVSPNPPPFKGGTNWIFSVTNSPIPDKHAVVLYKDVVDANFNVQDFDVTMTATLSPADTPIDGLTFHWEKIEGPDSGQLLPSGLTAIYRNPKKGGVYRFRLTVRQNDIDRSFGEAVLVLPIAGAEVDSLIAANLTLADAFATKVVAAYSPLGRNDLFNGLLWFNNDGAGDYLGRPNNGLSSTVWYYNQVNRDGFAAVCTWKGKPIRTAKLGNFMVAYGARKIGVFSPLAWVAQIIGTQNDASATKSWDAGWSIGGGAAYGATVESLVSDIWNDDDDPNHKNMKLWPNPRSLDNYVAPDLFYNPDTQFTVPGFLYMESP